MNHKFLTLSVSSAALLLASCAMLPADFTKLSKLMPDFTKPNVDLPTRWQDDAKDKFTGQTVPAEWWTVFGDDQLTQLVSSSLKNNLDVAAGVERINQSRAALRAAGASLLPSADATASLGKERTNPPQGKTDTTTPVSAGLSIAYELDLFGKNAAKNESARAMLRSSELTQKALELSISGDVAEAYFNLLLTQERLRIGQENLKNANELLRIVEARVNAGVDSNLELSQQKVALANREAALSSLTQTEVIYKNALAILDGALPQGYTPTIGNLTKLSVPTIAPEQPSTLLERRPDIAAMEQKLVASHADIAVARAAFFPSISLGGSLTAAGTTFSDPLTTVIGAASSLTAPIFQGGRLEAGVELATAEQKEMIANYRKTILTAYGEVENALSAVRTTGTTEDALKTAVSEARKAYEISLQRYQVGTIDFATMLDTQANLLDAEDNHAQAMKSRLSASLDLIKALGGGWKP